MAQVDLGRDWIFYQSNNLREKVVKYMSNLSAKIINCQDDDSAIVQQKNMIEIYLNVEEDNIIIELLTKKKYHYIKDWTTMSTFLDTKFLHQQKAIQPDLI